MIRSPFPGMDHYLEQDWLDVHSRLMYVICDQLQDQLPRDLCARMESRVVVEREDDEPSDHPDVRIVETRLSGTAVLERPQASTIEPDLFLVEARGEPATQRFVQIVDSQTRSRVVTTIELISPSNKRPGPGMRLYLTKRDECLDGGVNFVEIDLTRSGDRDAVLPMLGRLQPRPTYVGCVRRAERPTNVAVYLMPLAQPIKPKRIPLRPSDEDAILQLQPIVETAYDRGRYDTLDYSRPLDPPLAGAEAEFAEGVLQQAGKQ